MLTGAAAAVAGLGLLAGCGSNSSPPRSASATVTRMRSVVKAARSVHLDGVLRSGGKAIGLNLGLTSSGGFAGTITENGVPLTLVDAGDKVYVKATAPFLAQLRVPASACSIMCGKYVEMSGSQGDELAGNLNMSSLLASFTGRLPRFTDAGTTTVAGHAGQVLLGPDGSRLVVAAAGPPYPLQAVARQGNGSLDFSQWNAVPRPVAPPAGQVIDLSKLTG
ncbi:MAG TPA: hypothetical protein VMI33_02030 [Streptosporangiaceae bacterium]|nr:hypothetical protein [Streptosporangiaceae bacterium]